MRRILLVLTVALVMATIIPAMALPAFAGPKAACKAGNGNGNEFCDPGNSVSHNKGGDEIQCIPEIGGSASNPGGNNEICGIQKGS
jgi:hypothetical protein